jgi:AAA family ATP:ADP antiporter
MRVCACALRHTRNPVGFATKGARLRSNAPVTTADESPWLALVRRVAPVEPGELAPVAWAFAQFVCVLTATFVVRPVRDEMGIAGGVDELAWMFTATFVATIALVPLYGWAAARLGRRPLSVAVYGVLGASMIGLWAVFEIAPAELVPWISRAAFVWLSVINMVAVAAFWSSVVDVFEPMQGQRLFGLVAAGGSLGAIVGPTIARALADQQTILVASALAFVAALACGVALDRSVEGRPSVVSGTKPIGGGMLEGLREVARPGPLRGIAIYVALYTGTSTVLYVVQATIVKGAIADPGDRIDWFASIDQAVNLLAICAQLALFGHLARRLALAAVLVVLPVVTVGALAVLGAWPTLGLLAIAQTLRRATEHAVAKPGRELLYARLDREAKFKGQNAVDTVVYRACDAAWAWLVRVVADVVGGVTAQLWAFAPIALLWVWWGWRLGRNR